MDFVISLTSVPRRFDRIGPVLKSLLRQRPAPAAVILCLPDGAQPEVPDGVELRHFPTDIGPGLKTCGRDAGLMIYCDDDWIAGPGWAAALLGAYRGGEAVTGQGFDLHRLGRWSGTEAPYTDIAQGFSGVLVDAAWLADATPPEDLAARMVDDIWLSAHLAAKGIAIREVPAARRAQTLAFEDQVSLQDQVIDGLTRAEANRRCAALMAKRYGIWPELSSSTARAARR